MKPTQPKKRSGRTMVELDTLQSNDSRLSSGFDYDAIERALDAMPEGAAEALQDEETSKLVAFALARLLVWIMPKKHRYRKRKFNQKFAKVFTQRGLAALWTLRPDLLDNSTLRHIGKGPLGKYSRLAFFASEFSDEFNLKGMRQRRLPQPAEPILDAE